MSTISKHSSAFTQVHGCLGIMFLSMNAHTSHALVMMKLRFRRELKDKEAYQRLSVPQKEAFRLAWAKEKHVEVTKKSESTSKSEQTKSVRKWLTRKQLVSFYKSKKTAANHFKFCMKQAGSGTDWIRHNSMAGEKQFLLIDVSEEKKSKHPWELVQEGTVAPLASH